MAAEEVESRPETSPNKPKGRGLSLVLVAILMGAEGVGVFFLTKMFASSEPSSAAASEGESAPAPPTEGHAAKSEHGATGAVGGQAEIELTECRPSNKMTGKLITLKIRVSALVASAEVERARTLAEANKARINDRVNFVIRSAEPQALNEPGLETIKRRLKHELAKVLGDEQLIQEVLIPEMLQSGSGL
jgi:flagellar basal body-associated protein FliL